MGEVFETPIRELVEGGLERVGQYVETNGTHLIFCWLALIFLKTHLKDWRLPLHRDRRSGDLRKIGSAYGPVSLQHIHVLARSFFTESIIEKGAMGSLLILPAERADEMFRPFDFADFYGPNSILLRLDDVCFVAVLDDGCGVNNFYLEHIQRVSAPLLPVQLREVLGEMSCIAANLKERPTFHSRFEGSRHIIGAQTPARPELRNPLVECLTINST
ncbi:hypothetical protein F0U60_12805 [Archangium minus]|uniref:Uncharacterized protein n=1 Tax=Archangium minus TaxID=83450 RepID=A0ABY9WM68_9BACT|nr:hypothetical protein F0U60_12805 [Archangium minus]